MYSVVLMMALTGGAEAPDCHRGSGGCQGAVAGCYGGAPVYTGGGCYGGAPVYGGCYGGAVSYGCSGYANNCGCHGGRGGLFARHRHGCNGGCYGGCTGGAVVSYGGCTGGMPYAPAGCFGGTPYVTPVQGIKPMPPGGPKGEVVPPPKKEGSDVSAPATLVVTLPADARLTVDGHLTTSTSGTRVFVTPVLATGGEYAYNLTATVVRNGETLTQTQRVQVRPGVRTEVPFTFASSEAVTSR